MNFIADLHIHSHYSLATSKQLTPSFLDYWGKIKGVNLIATGDFTHPRWSEELKEALEPAEDGLFKLKKDFILPNIPVDKTVRFILSAEISNIYKKNGRVRKIHNVILAPDFQTVEKIQKKFLERKFNIYSDGRPILGLDARDLLEILLDINPQIMFIPAHIWTPWFALLGSKSGFDSPQECFEDLTKYIFAVETGLSSDLPMNWLCSFLDKFTLISNSDAHSPEKLGRNANIFNTELSYFAIRKALENQQTNEFIGTIDLYPQEGKYHYDGHRKCGIRWDPVQTLEHGAICPVCGKPVTLGVAHRVAELADRDDINLRPNKKLFKYLIPLKEIIAEILGVSPNAKSVDNQYFKLVTHLGSELDILFKVDIDSIKKVGGEILAEAIKRMRNNRVFIEEGFDGQYGRIKLFAKGELKNYGIKKNIFSVSIKETTELPPERSLLNFDVKRFLELKKQVKTSQQKKNKLLNIPLHNTLTEEQRLAVESQDNLFVVAGPGTGKTKVLTEKILYLINHKKIDSQSILAITFTHQAAEEIKTRLSKLFGKDKKLPTIGTFHFYALQIFEYLHQDFTIINDVDKRKILEFIEVPKKRIRKILNIISLYKNTFDKNIFDKQTYTVFTKYQQYLYRYNLIDLDDLILKATEYLKANKKLKEVFSKDYILIDEFQDINNAQYEFMKQLTGPNTNLFAIGDFNQSIYAFRGADNSINERFINEFNARRITFSYSFRCTNNILTASSQVIEKQSLKGKEQGVKINITQHPTQKAEAEFIARTIEKLIGGVRFFSIDSNITQGYDSTEFDSLSEFAVLTRTKDQHKYLIEAFDNHGIPYIVIGDEPFYAQEPFIDLINILRFLLYPEKQFIRMQVRKYLTFLAYNKHKNFIDLLQSLWVKFFEKFYPDKKTLFERFILLAEQKSDLRDFVNFLTISRTADDYKSTVEAVRIMTLHASKGLEFECVFIAGCVDGIIPYTIYRSDADVDEERRLFYVGMTRAKRYLYLTYSSVFNFQNKNFKFMRSRFIDKIEDDLLHKIKVENKPKKAEHPKLF